MELYGWYMFAFKSGVELHHHYWYIAVHCLLHAITVIRSFEYFINDTCTYISILYRRFPIFNSCTSIIISFSLTTNYSTTSICFSHVRYNKCSLIYVINVYLNCSFVRLFLLKTITNCSQLRIIRLARPDATNINISEILIHPSGIPFVDILSPTLHPRLYHHPYRCTGPFQLFLPLCLAATRVHHMPVALRPGHIM